MMQRLLKNYCPCFEVEGLDFSHEDHSHLCSDSEHKLFTSRSIDPISERQFALYKSCIYWIIPTQSIGFLPIATSAAKTIPEIPESSKLYISDISALEGKLLEIIESSTFVAMKHGVFRSIQVLIMEEVISGIRVG